MKKVCTILCSLILISTTFIVTYAFESQSNKLKEYEYKTYQIKDTYQSKKGKLLGEIEIDVTFRYNRDSHEVKCLSATHNAKNIAPKHKLKTFARTNNKTTSLGGSLIKVKVLSSSFNLMLQKKYYEVTCDCNGEIHVEKFTIK